LDPICFLETPDGKVWVAWLNIYVFIYQLTWDHHIFHLSLVMTQV
jgi:hypothetical protein